MDLVLDVSSFCSRNYMIKVQEGFGFTTLALWDAWPKTLQYLGRTHPSSMI
ncbi:hypothetical protein Taro_004753 [Colocasia esculenta]|uniref:Uncharacterized protein n=1 Tax=Colocasia esculenta TaxID=4460 RepID=A0A843TSJ0_COLES|nr:hypothetical protein [Colocasia esculenta]